MQNSELKIFNYENTSIRTTIRDGEVWWVLKDVCQILGIINHKDIISKLEPDERGIEKIDSLGGPQQTTIINEAGLYKTIFRSNKPEAKKFMHWVTHEVLPSIRKHGAYITAERIAELLEDPDTMVELVKTLQKERAEKAVLQTKIESDKPKVVFADAVSVTDNSILIGQLAKILKGNGIDIGQNRLFEILRREDFLIRRKGSDYNCPTQKAMDRQLFKIKETAVTHSDGHVTISKTVKVTGKGQVYFVNWFLNENNIRPKLNMTRAFGSKRDQEQNNNI